jgi:arylsulfatase A-like enzyme
LGGRAVAVVAAVLVAAVAAGTGAILLTRSPSSSPRTAGSGSASGPVPSSSPSARPLPTVHGKPSIVLILSDDQRWDTLDAMPEVQSELVGHGITFTNSFVVNPECCPSRASILTGQYSHTTGVYKNTPPMGGFSSFRDSDTIATRLHGAGYRTALIGKYLNGYAKTTYIPPGWDRWVAFTSSKRGSAGNGDYFDYDLTIDGRAASHGHRASDYSTDVLADQAVSFIQDTKKDQPLFLYFAPKAPHEPPVPAPRDRNAFADLGPWRPASYDEPDVSDKPDYIRRQAPFSAFKKDALDAFRLEQYRTLLAVDDAVGRIVKALDESGRLANTLLVYASDNGYMWGEHRWRYKLVPYEESIRVPLVIRFDARIPVVRTEENLVLNIDWAPTFAQVAGVHLADPDGTSLLPLLDASSDGVDWRTDFLVEHLQGSDAVPTYCAVRGQTWYYVRYATGEEEYYDLARDPLELDNRALDFTLTSEVLAAHQRLRRLCRPPPPGLSP